MTVVPITTALPPAETQALAPITLVMSDVVGSTEISVRRGDVWYLRVMECHDRVMREGLSRFNGEEIDHVGDGLLMAFSDPSDAARYCLAVAATSGRCSAVRLGLSVRLAITIGSPLRRDRLRARTVTSRLSGPPPSHPTGRLPGVTEMLLLRHGQSTWNAQHRWQGQANPPLSDLGRAQAVHAGQRLGSVDAIVTSPLDRALQTAVILAEAIGVGPVEVVPTLAERDAGPWSGLTRDEIEERWPGYLREQKRPEGYELDPALLDRIGATLDRLAARFGDGQLLVVCHGGVINAIERMLGEPWVRLANLDGRWITIQPATDPQDWQLGPRIQLVDDDELSETPKDMV